jgi:hypothetical protein
MIDALERLAALPATGSDATNGADR